MTPASLSAPALHIDEENTPQGAHDTCKVLLTGAALITERITKVLHPDAPMVRIEQDVFLVDDEGTTIGIARLCAHCNQRIRDRMGLFMWAAGKKE